MTYLTDNHVAVFTTKIKDPAKRIAAANKFSDKLLALGAEGVVFRSGAGVAAKAPITLYVERSFLLGRDVEVYYNLNVSAWSVRDKKSGLIIAHLAALELTDATFRVSEAGRKRVISEGRKNVHAFIRGTISEVLEESEPRTGATPIYYNPYKVSTFIDKYSGLAIDSASRVAFSSTRKATGDNLTLYPL